jgi:hypothetical protein
MTGHFSLISKGKMQYHAIHFSRTSLLQKGSIPPSRDPVKPRGQTLKKAVLHRAPCIAELQEEKYTRP